MIMYDKELREHNQYLEDLEDENKVLKYNEQHQSDKIEKLEAKIKELNKALEVMENENRYGL